MLSAAGAKHLLLLSSLVTNARAVVMLSAAGAKHPLSAAKGLLPSPPKAGPSLRARAARSAQDDRPLGAFKRKKKEPEFRPLV